MKKGFTLIELLAVIVILAVIALIATPVVLSIINDTKVSALLRSAEFYVNSVENSIMRENMNSGGSFNPKECVITNGNVVCDNTKTLEVEVNGEAPTSGIISFKSGKIMSVSLTFDDRTIFVNENGDYVYKNDLCTLIKGDSDTVGSKYICEVKPGVDYTFFVLSTNDKNVNLILDRNINTDGTLATKGIKQENAVNGVYNLMEWISESDYIAANTDSTVCSKTSCNEEGPITAMKALDNATSSWSNIPNLKESYEDEGGNYKTLNFSGKARLPKVSELYALGCTKTKKSCPLWVINNLSSNETYGDDMQIISGIAGYWTLSSYNSATSNYYVMRVHYYGNIDIANGSVNHLLGLRPVISIPKSKI